MKRFLLDTGPAQSFLNNGPLPAFADHYLNPSAVASIAFRTTSGIHGNRRPGRSQSADSGHGLS